LIWRTGITNPCGVGVLLEIDCIGLATLLIGVFAKGDRLVRGSGLAPTDFGCCRHELEFEVLVVNWLMWSLVPLKLLWGSLC